MGNWESGMGKARRLVVASRDGWNRSRRASWHLCQYGAMTAHG